jgi:hypothetical protein
MKGQQRGRLNNTCLEGSSLDLFFFFLFDRTCVIVSMSPSMQGFDAVLCCCFAPIFINAVFQLDNCEIADFTGNGMVKENVLQVETPS